MLFTEPTFLFGFLPILLALYYLARGRFRNWLLVGASVLFYARDGGAFTGLILGSIVVNAAAAVQIDRLHGTPAAARLLRVVVVLNLLSLGVFKYLGFIISNANTVLSSLSLEPLTAPVLLLPIGISFFTFHSISYVVDVHRRRATAQKGPVNAALYLLLFPQLIAGPIIRYHEIVAQLGSRPHTTAGFAIGVRRFIVGLAKKVLVAGIVAGPADAIFALPPEQLTAAHAWLAVFCYTLQIYFDFSGYSDMAIGLGRMFGFTFPENFRYPYVATSIQDFWRRWHMTLSSWFRDYVYIPLGGSRRSTRRVYLNLTAVFFLCGLWHGARWTFVIWGLLHGLFLVLERVGLDRWLTSAPRALARTYVLAVVMVGWVFFRAGSFSAAMAMLGAMVGAGGGQPTTYAASWYLTPELLLAILAGVVGSAPVIPMLARLAARSGESDGTPAGPWAVGATVALVALLAASITLVARGTFSPFIYFRF